MSIAIFDEAWSGRTTDGVALGTRQYTRVFFVMTDSSDDDETDIRSHDQCPKKGDSYGPKDTFAYLNQLRTTKTGPLTWTVEATYIGQGFDPNTSVIDQLKLIPKLAWTSTEEDIPIRFDQDGRPFVNSVGDDYEGITKPVTDAVLTWRGYFDSFNHETFFTYNNSVNADHVLSIGAPPHCAKLKIVGAEDVEIEKTILVQVTLQIQLRMDRLVDEQLIDDNGVDIAADNDKYVGWDLVLRNEGRRFRKVAVGPLLNHVDDSDKPTGQIVPLRASGILAETRSQWRYKKFRRLPAVSWAPLGIV